MLKALKNRTKDFLRASSILKHYSDYRSDPHYDLGALTKGFQQRGSLPISDEAINRIITAYNKAKAKQGSVAPHFLVSNEWLPIYEKKFGQAIKALTNRDTDAVRKMYQNFFREDVSVGLHGLPVDMKSAYFSGKISKRNAEIFLVDTLYRFKLWKKLTPDGKAADLARPDIGNPYGISIDGSYITPGAEYHHYYARKCASLCSIGESATVLELGGGYGGYAYFLHQAGRGNVRYIDIDLPEVLALATFYLMSVFPDGKFALFGEFENQPPEEFDFLMLPNFAISSIKAASVQVIFNAYSLAEMSPEAIFDYVREFGRMSKGYLLHINHVENAVLGADAFKIEPAGFSQIHREKALWNMGRNLKMDEYEFLFRKN